MKVEIKGDTLVITVPFQSQPFPDSKSGKTKVIATTNGNKPSGIEIEGQEIIVGMNAFIYKPKK